MGASCRSHFNEFCRVGRLLGLLSNDDCNTIARPGTRKNHYWCSHLATLESILRLRMKIHGPNKKYRRLLEALEEARENIDDLQTQDASLPFNRQHYKYYQ